MAQADFRAGLNGAMLAFAQGMAYASIAGLPIQYGIYCTAVAAVIGGVFSASRYAVVGPTNSTAVLVLSSYLLFQGQIDEVASIGLFCLMVGFFLIVGAAFGVAGLIRFVSRTVITGYIAAAAVLIVVHQMGKVLGLHLSNEGTFWGICKETLFRLPQSQLPTVLLSLATLAFWFWIRKVRPDWPVAMATLLFSSLVALGLDWSGLKLDFLEPFPLGGWKIGFPEMDFLWLSQLSGAALAVAFLALVETASVAKSLAGRAGTRVNMDQEMFSLGMANVACAFFGGMPASGSPTRSTLNWSSGAATPVSGMVNGLLCAAAALLMGPLIRYVPAAGLAVAVIMVGISLVHPDHIRIALKATRSDCAVFLITFGAGLIFPLSTAIFLGVGASIILFLRKAGSPDLKEYSFQSDGQLSALENVEARAHQSISIIHVEGDLFFGAAELFQDQIRRVCDDTELKVVILRLRNAYHLDGTSVMALEELINYLGETGRHLIISGARRDVFKVVKNSGLLEKLGRENFFLTSAQNPNLSTRNALKRAKELIGGGKAEIKIFYDPQKKSAPEG